ncbi:MAG: hypothetical protein HON90_03380 [Halobacteriovoraceae bacterium]|jgi:hypothetical protein|nr:hypothetical protein [Halobacteriovoraceae bacterium]
MILKPLQFFLFLSLFSCSLIIDNFEEDILTQNKITPLNTTSQISCPTNSSHMLISENKDSQLSFNKFIKKTSNKFPFSFVDEAVMWSLVQMNLRPDLSSPSAKLQLLIKINDKEEYINSYETTNNGFPYFNALEFILKKYQSRYSLIKLAKIIDIHFKKKFLASKEFERFVDDHKNQIIANPTLKQAFFRGDEPLLQGERIPSINFTSLVRHYKRQKKVSAYKIKRKLFEYQTPAPVTPMCNFDLKLYDKSLFLINSKKIKTHTFGIKSAKNAFMAISTQDFQEFKLINKTFLLRGFSNTRSSSLCSFKNINNKGDTLWLTSSESRDPGQHLYHLFQYGIEKIKTITELNSMLSFSRHQFLKDPVRLIIESRRSSKGQLRSLLKLNIPIYNAKRLGTIWGYYRNSSHSSFLLDERRQGHLACSSN